MVLNSSQLISRSINALDIKVLILFNLLLVDTKILLLFLFLVILNNVFVIPAVKENTRLKFVTAIPTGTPVTLTK